MNFVLNLQVFCDWYRNHSCRLLLHLFGCSFWILPRDAMLARISRRREPSAERKWFLFHAVLFVVTIH